MDKIIHSIGELMTIASSLPIMAAIPLYGIVYCIFAYCLLLVIKKAKEVLRG